MHLSEAIMVAIVTGTFAVIVAGMRILEKLISSDVANSDHKQRDGDIINKLYHFRHDYSIRRVLIMKFHNGGSYYTGEGISKVTAAYESMTHNVEPVQQNYQAITSSVLADSPALVERNGLMFDSDVTNADGLAVQNRKYLRTFRSHGSDYLISWGIYQNKFSIKKMRKIRVLVGIMYIEMSSDNLWVMHLKSNPAELATFCRQVTDISIAAFPDCENKSMYQELRNAMS